MDVSSGSRLLPFDRRHFMYSAEQFLDIREHRFARLGLVIPRVHLGNPQSNRQRHREELEKVWKAGASYALCPELGISGYSCGDLFHSQTLLEESQEALLGLIDDLKETGMLVSVGVPLPANGMLFNAAVTFYGGRILAAAPKSYLPTYREFYEGRYFASGHQNRAPVVRFCGQEIPFGTDILIRFNQIPGFVLHTDVCEDIWVPVPPGTLAAQAGATVLANLSASNITVGKTEYRRLLVRSSSGRNIAVQLYSAAGFGESTQDVAWDGQGIIAERSVILKESERFQIGGTHIVADVDLEAIELERMRQNSFRENAANQCGTFREVSVVEEEPGRRDTSVYMTLMRAIDPHPFVPSDPTQRDERCREVFKIQATSLARRLLSLPANSRRVTIGVSGGQDSTHALNVAAHTMDLLSLPRSNIIAMTMPGFGTTDRTYHNAVALIRAVRATFLEIKISPIVEQIFTAIRYDRSQLGLVFENCQAWTRKLLELAIACHQRGINLGTSDLSELMLGWTTMFGDHAAHYGVNVGVPKTLISYLIGWTADELFKEEPSVQQVLHDILATEISPELLPHDAGLITQKTQETIGPYELHDFFGYYFMRFGFSPLRIARLALHAFEGRYTIGEIKNWLRVFITRFFANQFKRSCLPDGPKVGTTCVSPGGDWRMQSDAEAEAWLRSLELVPNEL
jgi:NAD+ synthase (glutamine-hydrolysing)